MFRMFERFLDKVLRDAFPGVEPFKFAYGSPGLGPLRTELLGLKRNHARDEIKLNRLYEECHIYGYSYPWVSAFAWPNELRRLQDVQDRREQRMRDIEAKLKRDGRLKTKPATQG
jgi:hypothetical protein